jgi:hypothetical protein
MKTIADINKEISGIKVAGAKLDGRIQGCGVDVLEHFSQHKDTGVVNRLYQALPKGSRSTALASWLLAYGALVANTDAKTKADQPFVYSKEKVTDPLGASQDMWFNHKPEKTPDQVFDLQMAIRALLKKAGAAPSIKGGDYETLKAIAKASGISESDVPTLPKKPTAEAVAIV